MNGKLSCQYQPYSSSKCGAVKLLLLLSRAEHSAAHLQWWYPPEPIVQQHFGDGQTSLQLKLTKKMLTVEKCRLMLILMALKHEWKTFMPISTLLFFEVRSSQTSSSSESGGAQRRSPPVVVST
mmetsp:Transcript_111518/g.193281  ORF Transcript_111518/g.193281 Transcript_111518/m.193281 type:complete len:124 (-) Transcript_111518:21-392(-)